ncbi:hypothetical protein KEM48_011639, partial [Puccinia striiformis f. sp. tritici PST-130]
MRLPQALCLALPQIVDITLRLHTPTTLPILHSRRSSQSTPTPLRWSTYPTWD